MEALKTKEEDQGKERKSTSEKTWRWEKGGWNTARINGYLGAT